MLTFRAHLGWRPPCWKALFWLSLASYHGAHSLGSTYWGNSQLPNTGAPSHRLVLRGIPALEGDSESDRVPSPISFLCLHPSGSGIQGEVRVQTAMAAVCIYARHSGLLPTVAATRVTSLVQIAKAVKVGCSA